MTDPVGAPVAEILRRMHAQIDECSAIRLVVVMECPDGSTTVMYGTTVPADGTPESRAHAHATRLCCRGAASVVDVLLPEETSPRVLSS